MASWPSFCDFLNISNEFQVSETAPTVFFLFVFIILVLLGLVIVLLAVVFASASSFFLGIIILILTVVALCDRICLRAVDAQILWRSANGNYGKATLTSSSMTESSVRSATCTRDACCHIPSGSATLDCGCEL